ncbi:hypothetical protein D6T63_13055 [Arthrobacter cheniae]|uniref:WXG100 family type VII secretion target n=1 Tax=Arthrobacter cheniae TaxID=1258888 RepID=A0A3A5M053_9MICC|nr:hypothetical protein [Arthrobacter cheniae]RJT78433.1 hypothetical protein D6T63_13055 [Arthrobacter cheniae]
MAFDTSGLQQWASPGELEAAAGDIASAGADVSTTVDGLSSTWSGLSGSYQAPEQVEVLAVFTSITPHGDVVDLAAGQAQTALAAFAGTVRELEAERTALLAEISSFEADPPTVDPADPDSPVDAAQQGWLQGDIDRLAGRYDDAVTTCVAALKGIDGTVDNTVSTLSGPEAGLVVAASTNYSSTHTFKRVDITAYRQVPMPWQQFRFTPLDPTGPLTAAEIAGDRYLNIGGREIHISNPDHPDYGRTVSERYTRNGFAAAVDWRPEVHERFYDLSSAYRARVDANPGDWKPAPTSSTPRPTFGELPHGLKALKVGGGVVAVGMAGLTIADERAQAYDRLLVESPRMSEADRNARANELGAVRGGAKTAVDLGAGVAGAAVGTMIGGPVGTVIGFGVGMGISYLADQDLPDWLGGGSVKDAAADLAENAYDGTKEALSDAGDAISEGWNSVFG